MNKRELINLLESTPCPDETLVMISGYEAGLEDIEIDNISICKVKLNANTGSYLFGPHKLQDKLDASLDAVDAIFIDRN